MTLWKLLCFLCHKHSACVAVRQLFLALVTVGLSHGVYRRLYTLIGGQRAEKFENHWCNLTASRWICICLVPTFTAKMKRWEKLSIQFSSKTSRLHQSIESGKTLLLSHKCVYTFQRQRASWRSLCWASESLLKTVLMWLWNDITVVCAL